MTLNKEEMETAVSVDIKVEIEQALSSQSIIIEKKPIYSFFKRLTDIIVSFFGLIILLIPSAILCLIIVLSSPGASPIYKQKRVGKNGKEFVFYKFRSMKPNADQMLEELLAKNEMEGPVFKIENDPRLTKVGRFIRKTSIDEFPQLWNVLKGDMSLVGPRPPLPREVKYYNESQKIRLAIKPGITCYWQVQPKRNSLSFDKWVELDKKYIEERSIWTDIKIFFKTFGAIFGMEGQ